MYSVLIFLTETVQCEGAVGGMRDPKERERAEDSDEEDAKKHQQADSDEDDDDKEYEKDEGEDKESFMSALQNFLMQKLHLTGQGETPQVGTIECSRGNCRL